MKKSSAILPNSFAQTAWEESDETSAEVERRTWVLDFAQHGWRLDKILVHIAPEFSRSYLQQLIVQGLVAVNAQVIRKPAHKLKFGDVLELELRATPQSQAFQPQDMSLDVVHADDDIFVLNKTAGVVVHPAPGHWSGTLLNGLLAHDPALSLVPRAGIVHRLDKDTSGLMVVARHRAAMDKLVQAMAARHISRNYLAVAHGPWQGARTVSVNLPLGRDPRHRVRMAVVDLEKSSGKPAKTQVTLLGNTASACLVRCVLHTGRTHQIRVHMASLGHPLIGDVIYGGVCIPGMTRQALHAYQLSFSHPMHGKTMTFEAPLPADLQSLLDLWGLRYNGA